jgi:hypothetical protein
MSDSAHDPRSRQPLTTSARRIRGRSALYPRPWSRHGTWTDSWSRGTVAAAAVVAAAWSCAPCERLPARTSDADANTTFDASLSSGVLRVDGGESAPPEMCADAAGLDQPIVAGDLAGLEPGAGSTMEGKGACVARDIHTSLPEFCAPATGPGYSKRRIVYRLPATQDPPSEMAALNLMYCDDAMWERLTGLACAASAGPITMDAVRYPISGSPDGPGRCNQCAMNDCDPRPCP